MENHFLVKIIEWGTNKHDGFTYGELFQEFNNLTGWQYEMVDMYFKNAVQNSQSERLGKPHIPETIFYQISGVAYNNVNTKYVLTAETLFRYIDFSELKFARKNATDARRLAIYAIIISAGIPMIIQLLSCL